MSDARRTTRQPLQTSVQQAVTATGTAAHALPGGLGARREVRLFPSVACRIRFGVPQASPNQALLDTPASTGANSYPLADGAFEVLSVPDGATHFAVIRAASATQDGVIDVHAVV